MKKFTMVEFEIDMDVDLKNRLLKVAKEQIVQDETALLNWIVNKAIMVKLENGEKK